MDLVFRYRMLSDESDHFVRDLEVMPEMTLTEFHRFVFEALGYDEAMVSIFASDEMWKRQQEYTQIDMGGDAASAPKPMDSVRLLEVTDRLHGRMIYVFDMLNDRALYLELVEVKRPEAGMEYPRVAFELRGLRLWSWSARQVRARPTLAYGWRSTTPRRSYRPTPARYTRACP